MQMSVKQDRGYARTAQDIERKYSFGKTFADMLGLINDNRDKVDSVSSSVGDIAEMSSELKRDMESLSFKINEVGVDKVTTTTGYKFDKDGLHISKTSDPMSNKIDNTGMYVKRYGEDILTATDKGVDAVNLHAKTYLIVGAEEGRSRFEDYGANETGCFWIGG
jgi:hypothetical protein